MGSSGANTGTDTVQHLHRVHPQHLCRESGETSPRASIQKDLKILKKRTNKDCSKNSCEAPHWGRIAPHISNWLSSNFAERDLGLQWMPAWLWADRVLSLQADCDELLPALFSVQLGSQLEQNVHRRTWRTWRGSSRRLPDSEEPWAHVKGRLRETGEFSLEKRRLSCCQLPTKYWKGRAQLLSGVTEWKSEGCSCTCLPSCVLERPRACAVTLPLAPSPRQAVRVDPEAGYTTRLGAVNDHCSGPVRVCYRAGGMRALLVQCLALSFWPVLPWGALSSHCPCWSLVFHGSLFSRPQLTNYMIHVDFPFSTRNKSLSGWTFDPNWLSLTDCI